MMVGTTRKLGGVLAAIAKCSASYLENSKQ